MPKDSDGEEYPLWEDVTGEVDYIIAEYGPQLLVAGLVGALVVWLWARRG